MKKKKILINCQKSISSGSIYPEVKPTKVKKSKLIKTEKGLQQKQKKYGHGHKIKNDADSEDYLKEPQEQN